MFTKAMLILKTTLVTNRWYSWRRYFGVIIFLLYGANSCYFANALIDQGPTKFHEKLQNSKFLDVAQ